MCLAVVLVSLWTIVVNLPARAGVSAFRPEGLTFADDSMRQAFDNYLKFLQSDPETFAPLLATVEQLRESDISYVVTSYRPTLEGVEGCLTSDGQSIFINLTNVGGPQGEVASLNSRIAHELEHARQFDDGEIGFSRDAQTGNWNPTRASYDIGDEVKAWEVQLLASQPKDFWIKSDGLGVWVPSLLRLFADAPSPEAKSDVLRAHGYTDRYPLFNSQVAFPKKAGYQAGTVVRPEMRKDFFGRVFGDRDEHGDTVARKRRSGQGTDQPEKNVGALR